MRSGFSQPRSFLHTATGACPGQLSPGHRALSFVCGQPTPGTNGAHLYLHTGKERSLSQHPAHLQQLLPVLLFFFFGGGGGGVQMGRDERSLPTRERRLGVSSWERRLSLLESSPYNLFKRGEQKCGSLFCVSPAPAGEPAAGAPCARGRRDQLQGLLVLVAGVAPRPVPASWARGHGVL